MMVSGGIIAVAVVFSILGLILIVYILINVLLLWQAKRLGTTHGNDEQSLKTECLKSHSYQVRSYIGCFPRLKGPRRTLFKKSEYSIRQCWFRLCCLCCQELHEKQAFLDEVFVPPGVITAASKSEKLHTLSIPPTNFNAPNGHEVTLDTNTSQRRENMPKISILAPDPIVVQMDRYTPAQTTILEDTEPVDFYAYQLEGKAGERMLY